MFNSEYRLIVILNNLIIIDIYKSSELTYFNVLTGLLKSAATTTTAQLSDPSLSPCISCKNNITNYKFHIWTLLV